MPAMASDIETRELVDIQVGIDRMEHHHNVYKEVHGIRPRFWDHVEYALMSAQCWEGLLFDLEQEWQAVRFYEDDDAFPTSGEGWALVSDET